MKKLILAMTVMMSSGIQLMRGAVEKPEAPAIFALLAEKNQNLGNLFSKKCERCVGNDGQAILHVQPISSEDVADKPTYLLVCCKNTDAKRTRVAMLAPSLNAPGLCINFIPYIFKKSVEAIGTLSLYSDMNDLELQEGDQLFWGRLFLSSEAEDIKVFWVDGPCDYEEYLYPIAYDCHCHPETILVQVADLGNVDCFIS
jgi:hypothetical protein